MSDTTSDIPPPLEPVTQSVDPSLRSGRQAPARSAADLEAHRRASSNYRDRNLSLEHERARIRMAALRARVLNDDRIKEMNAERARKCSKGYRVRKAQQLAQDQRDRRQEAYCDKHGTKAWVVRAAKQRGRAAPAGAHHDSTQPTAGEGSALLTARQRHQTHRQCLKEEAEILAREIVWRREVRLAYAGKGPAVVAPKI
ncbi:hypothetical protein B0H13DRAFT_2315836 [Mycena leptocephala]|nr:hypothetical protein B0H13DRAFT_2315836 [Mycena leptocephala]